MWSWRRLKSPLDCSPIKSVNPKGNQPWLFIGRIDAKVEGPKLWPLDRKSKLFKKDWFWEILKAKGKGDSRAWDGYHHQLNGHEFEQTPGDSRRQSSLAYSWGCKESNLETEQQQQNDLFLINWQFFMAQDVISFGIYSMGIWKKKNLPLLNEMLYKWQ